MFNSRGKTKPHTLSPYHSDLELWSSRAILDSQEPDLVQHCYIPAVWSWQSARFSICETELVVLTFVFRTFQVSARNVLCKRGGFLVLFLSNEQQTLNFDLYKLLFFYDYPYSPHRAWTEWTGSN